jgi:hypothetical protein
MLLRRLLSGAVLSLGLAAGPALADGIELPKTVRPTPGGDYVVRSQLSTSQAVPGLQYEVFRVSADGRIGEPVEGTSLRPARLNTQPGVKNRVLVIVPGKAISGEQLLAVCMWKDPPTASGSQSQLLAMFRYCKLFTAKP